ncbi:MAG: hypothetical protein ABI281_08415 [Caldimonas sp.]
MKLLPTLVLALTATASFAAGAATYSSDQERRDQNREEALTKWRSTHGGEATMHNGSPYHASMADRARETTHRSAQGVRHFTHRQAEKARNFGDRQNRKYGKRTGETNTSPEGGK